jgi:hypothetical protein
MNDPATLSDIPPLNLSVDEHAASDSLELTHRIERLENEVAALKAGARQESAALEERICERVTERLQRSTRADQFTATPPMGSAARASYAEPTPSRPSARGYAWLFVDMFADARLMVLMLMDRRYTVAWTTHLVVWLFVPAILTSAWWFPFAYLPFFGHPFDKLLDLLLAFGVYKALSREVRRYREVIKERR